MEPDLRILRSWSRGRRTGLSGQSVVPVVVTVVAADLLRGCECHRGGPRATRNGRRVVEPVVPDGIGPRWSPPRWGRRFLSADDGDSPRDGSGKATVSDPQADEESRRPSRGSSLEKPRRLSTQISTSPVEHTATGKVAGELISANPADLDHAVAIAKAAQKKRAKVFLCWPCSAGKRE